MKCAPLLGSMIILATLASCFTPSGRPAALQDIARWQDQRLAPTDSLRAMIASDDAHLRLAAVRAAGLIGRDDVVPQVIEVLQDVSFTVRAEAAWALGLIGSATALPSLNEATTSAQPQVRAAALAALAHLENDGTALLAATTHDDPKSACLAWNGLRNQAARVDSSAIHAAIRAGLQRPESSVRWRVLRCIEQVGDTTLVPFVTPFVNSQYIDEVVHAHRALSRLSGPDVLPAVLAGWQHLETFKGRDLARSQIAACRALATAGTDQLSGPRADQIAALLSAAAGQADPHVAESALVAMAALVAEMPLPAEAADQESLLPVWRIRLARTANAYLASDHVGVRAAAVAALGALRGAGAHKLLLSAVEHESSPHVLSAALTTLAAYHPQPLATLSAYCNARDQHQQLRAAVVRAAALTGLNEVRLHRPEILQAPWENAHIEGKLLTAALESDFVVSTTAAELLGTIRSDESLLTLTSLWARATGPGEFDIRLGVISGLKALMVSVKADSSNPWQPADELQAEARRVIRQSFDSSDLRVRREGRQAAVETELLGPELIPSQASLAATLPAVVRDHRQPPVAVPFDAPSVRCISERGSFIIELDGQIAPNTCALFLSLIEKDYFGAMTFHRVVPDFVVQGGDPDGGGWGGPGFSIRSEWSQAKYVRAAVGIAHSGKDTGGSQFFVTLSPQPHLNGRYTIFGQVSQGMDVVDRLEVGDTFRLELAD